MCCKNVFTFLKMAIFCPLQARNYQHWTQFGGNYWPLSVLHCVSQAKLIPGQCFSATVNGLWVIKALLLCDPIANSLFTNDWRIGQSESDM